MAIENVAAVDVATGEVVNIVVWDTNSGLVFSDVFPGCEKQPLPVAPVEPVEPGAFVSVD